VNGRERARVPGIQGLEEIERLRAPDLADEDAIGPMPQRGPQQVANGDRRQTWLLPARLKPEQIVDVQLEFRRVFDQAQAVLGGHERDQGVEERRLPGPGPAADQDVVARLDRLALIEDTAELQLDADNLFRFEARREQAGLPAITIRDLLRASLRHRPDRILVGEVRGGEAFDLLQALNTGHAGTLSTIHANGAELALRRFTWCALQSGVDVPYPAIRHGLAECLQLLVHLERRRDRRLVTELVRVRRYNPGTDTYDLESL